MPEPLWTAEEIVRATGGDLQGAFACTGVSIDTRTIEPGDLFVALAGERDGHEFITQAMNRGAAGVLASKPVDAPAVRVADTLRALEQLGVAARERASVARRCAVTGSVGKTSVTQAIAAALKLAGPSHNSVLSYNNHIGVPLTLARMPRETERAVFEIGMNHAGEIRSLVTMVRPHVAVVTMVGGAHVENFSDGEAGVAKAKAEIFEGLEPGGVAVLNAEGVWFRKLAKAAANFGATIVACGYNSQCEAQLVEVAEARGGLMIAANLRGQFYRFKIAQPGLHWAWNSLTVLLALEALGVSFQDGIKALNTFAPLKGRGETHHLTIDGRVITLIDESYNANPISMRSALATLGACKAGRRIAVLTDMLELGQDSAALHAALAEPMDAAGVDLAFLAGPSMRALWEALPEHRRGAWRETAQALAPDVRAALKSGDVVMAKGSKGSKSSHVVEVLLDAGPTDSAPSGRT